MLKYLLDTNIVTYVIKQRPIEALAMFNKQHGRMAISTITLAELVLYWAQKKVNFQHAIWLLLKIFLAV